MKYFLFVLLVSILFAFQNDGSPQAEISITSEQLHAEYSANEVAADMKFKNIVLNVHGVIQDITKNLFDTPFVTLRTDQMFFNVLCKFNDDDLSTLAHLSKGTMVSITGKCVGMFMHSVILENCLLNVLPAKAETKSEMPSSPVPVPREPVESPRQATVEPSGISKELPRFELAYSAPLADYLIVPGDVEKNLASFESLGCFTVELHARYKNEARANMVKNVKDLIGSGEMKVSSEGGNPDLLNDVITISSFDAQKKTVTFSGAQIYRAIDGRIIGMTKVQMTCPLDSPKYSTMCKVEEAIEKMFQEASGSKSETSSRPTRTDLSTPVNPQRQNTPKAAPSKATPDLVSPKSSHRSRPTSAEVIQMLQEHP